MCYFSSIKLMQLAICSPVWAISWDYTWRIADCFSKELSIQWAVRLNSDASLTEQHHISVVKLTLPSLLVTSLPISSFILQYKQYQHNTYNWGKYCGSLALMTCLKPTSSMTDSGWQSIATTSPILLTILCAFGSLYVPQLHEFLCLFQWKL